MDFYKFSEKEVLKKLNSSESGLSKEQAEKRLDKYGLNEFRKFKKISSLEILIEQMKNFMIYVLVAAAVVSAFFGEVNDAIVIAVIIILNILLGFVQEYKAEKSIEALRKLSSPLALVLRDKKVEQIESKYLVPGDIIIIEEGQVIPADARILESNSLRIDESTFTGESVSIYKNTNTIRKSCIVSERKNMVFAGTIAVRGRGKAIVTKTGHETELGKIAKGIQETGDKTTPLQKQLNHLGVYITVAILLICAIIVVAELFHGDNLIEAFLVAVALAVAAIPEGLPAVITITLALGTQRMSKKNALIRKLPAVETLGSTTVICTDKTGTLTKNKMTVVEIYSNGNFLKVDSKKDELKGDFFSNGKKLSSLKNYEKLFEIGVLCNNAILDGPSDPTERAILVAGKKSGFNFKSQRIGEIPFTSETKYMITVNKEGKEKTSYLKGAPESVLKLCKKVFKNGKIQPLNKKERGEILKAYDLMGKKALRVLAFAYHPKGAKEGFVFAGLMGMKDPSREGVRESIEKCLLAGIRVIMITGDHSATANAIAKELGIKGKCLTGSDLDKMSLKELEKACSDVSVFARVSPQHKVRILEALKNKGEIVAMTGDGVNDAPALKMADIGTSVGSGTDVAKQASDMILLDDNFVSIVSAVMEGRGIYNNIKKFVNFLFSCNLGEVMVIFLALLLGFPAIPLLAIQILWVNLLTDGFPALALGMDPVDPEVMSKPPRKKKEKIITEKDTVNVLFQGLIITFGVLFLFSSYLPMGIEYAQTVAFTSLVLFQMFNVLNYRAGENSILSKELFANKWLLGAILLSLVLQVSVVYFFNDLFETVPLLLNDWIVILLCSSLILIIYEVIKVINKLKKNGNNHTLQ